MRFLRTWRHGNGKYMEVGGWLWVRVVSKHRHAERLDLKAGRIALEIKKALPFVRLQYSAELLRWQGDGAIRQNERFDSRDPILGLNEHSSGTGGKREDVGLLRSRNPRSFQKRFEISDRNGESHEFGTSRAGRSVKGFGRL